MDVLKRIFAQKRIDLERNRSETPLSEVKSRALSQSPPRGFRRAIEDSPHPVALIAEVKKASPVKGTIRADFDPVAIARTYASKGADCLSVLTDEEFFQGRPEFLTQCREATALPVLRKDFTVDEYDVWFARALGADAVLLISEYLSDTQLKDYREAAESLGMDALVEVHSQESAARALASGAALIGINNRNLRTFEVDLGATLSLTPTLVGKATVVSESAIASHEDVEKVKAAGARAVLVGTAFCKAKDIGIKVDEVMGW